MTKLEELALWALDRACDVDAWSEENHELLEQAVELGILKRIIYNPDEHGELEDCEPGDEVIWWGDCEPLKRYRTRPDPCRYCGGHRFVNTIEPGGTVPCPECNHDQALGDQRTAVTVTNTDPTIKARPKS